MRQKRARGGKPGGETQQATDPRLASGPKRPKPHSGGDIRPTARAIVSMPITEIDFDPRNRKSENITDDPKTHALARSMARMGQLHACIVVPRAVYLAKWPEYTEKLTRAYVVMVGNRRTAAAGLNGQPTVEVTTRDEITDDLTKLAELPIHENIHRKDLNPMDLAHWLSEQRPHYTNQEALAEALGYTQAWVSQLMGLLKLIPELQKMLEDDVFTAATGRKLVKLGKDGQRAVLEQANALPTDEDRADFWATYGRKTYPAPATDDEPAPTEPDIEPADEDADGDEQPAKPRPIVIKIGEWSAPRVVQTLRDTLTPDQWTELVREITAST